MSILFLRNYWFFLNGFILKLLIASKIINLWGIVCIGIVLIVVICFERILLLFYSFLEVHFFISLHKIIGFLFLHQYICFGNLYLLGLLGYKKRTLLLLFWFCVVSFYCSKGECFGGLYKVTLKVVVRCVSIS